MQAGMPGGVPGCLPVGMPPGMPAFLPGPAPGAVPGMPAMGGLGMMPAMSGFRGGMVPSMAVAFPGLAAMAGMPAVPGVPAGMPGMPPVVPSALPGMPCVGAGTGSAPAGALDAEELAEMEAMGKGCGKGAAGAMVAGQQPLYSGDIPLAFAKGLSAVPVINIILPEDPMPSTTLAPAQPPSTLPMLTIADGSTSSGTAPAGDQTLSNGNMHGLGATGAVPGVVPPGGAAAAGTRPQGCMAGTMCGGCLHAGMQPGAGGMVGMAPMGGPMAGGMGMQSMPPMGGMMGMARMNPAMAGVPAMGQVAGSSSAEQAARERAAALEDKRTASREEVDRFVESNRLDGSAVALFKKEPADIQANVIDRGSLAECKNPSAALMGRLRDARQNRFKPVGGSRGSGTAPTLAPGNAGNNTEVEEFIAENKIDMGAARALRAELPDIQQGVMDRGTLDGFQNPSALVMARIKDVKKVRQEAATRNVKPGEQQNSGGSSGQLTRELTRAELRRAVEERKAGKMTGTTTVVSAGRKSRSRSRRGRGRSGSGSRRRQSRSRSKSRGRRR